MTDVFFDSASSIPNQLNVSWRQDPTLVMRVHPMPETCRLGSLRTSVASYAADAVTGIAVEGDLDIWTFTSQMTLRMPHAPAPSFVEARATVLRQGGRSATCEATFVDDRGRPHGYSVLSFARVDRRDGDPVKRVFDPDSVTQGFQAPTIEKALPEAMGINVIDGAAGTVELPVTDKLRNPSGAMQGAMVACVAEVAAEEMITARLGRPAFVCDLDIRYLSQARIGPVRTHSVWLGAGPEAWVRVELHDVTTGQLLTHALARASMTT